MYIDKVMGILKGCPLPFEDLNEGESTYMYYFGFSGIQYTHTCIQDCIWDGSYSVSLPEWMYIVIVTLPHDKTQTDWMLYIKHLSWYYT